jgi:hypothetical protein
LSIALGRATVPVAMRRFTWIFVAAAGLLGGCEDQRKRSVPAPEAAPRKLAGVYPENWTCDSVASLDALGQILGGTVKPIDSPISVPKGLPHPCNYEVQAREPEYWTFDVDCRDGMKQRADALFAQYQATSHELVQQYDTLSDAGAIKPTDSGVAVVPPEEAVDVAVGAKGLDHHGRGLVFIDDDAPCYVRVVGKDAARRLELAKLIAKNLTFANAPMTPRAAP